MRSIYVLNHWWVVVGQPTGGDETTLNLTDAAVIRRWGTEKGLGQLAATGPATKTILDPIGVLNLNRADIIMSMPCQTDNWP